MSRRSRYNDYGGWPAYVPVAQRRANAKREVDKLRKKGEEIRPVEIEGRTIARSFWGKGWCTHLESFGDYSNRLPRGRTYVRNGSVCHLGIAKGKAEAVVSGSKLYRVAVEITPLKKAKWATLKQRCTGKIGSLIELLQGKLSEEIMGTVTDRVDGLFPLPGEITYRCNCPDWADMCKHIAAVMYGIGARLDQQPELLFLLRGVDHEELISTAAATEAITGSRSSRRGRRTLSGKSLESVFGVELDDTVEAAPIAAPKRQTKKRAAKPAKATMKAPKPRVKKKAPFKPTARSIAALRRRLGLSKAAFGRVVGVSATTVTTWERAVGTIRPQARGLTGLTRLHNQSG
ncbi:MAG: SWIM zinc finger family protein [Lentisphaerae bacterium]|nr:SWIM zinc finger family protein [Lentisphaerota bacterium]